MNRRKVLYVAPGPSVRGGITSVVNAYMNSEIRNTYDCAWLSTYDDRGFMFKIWAAFTSLAKAPFVFYNKDIIHIHVAADVSMFRKSLFVFIARFYKKKIVVHLHAAEHASLFSKKYRYIVEYVFRSADCIIALSEFWKVTIESLAPKSQVYVLPNPVDLPLENLKNTEIVNPIILYAGKLEERKGYADLIRAMPRIISSVPNAKLLMAGHGQIEHAKQVTKSLSLSSKVEFLGWVDGLTKEKAFKSAAVFCLPSYNEGVPMAMLEAMGYGVPVVMTPVGGIPDVIKDGVNGLLVEPGDSELIAAAIIRVLKDDRLSKALTESASVSVKSKFHISSVCKTLGNIYNGI